MAGSEEGKTPKKRKKESQRFVSMNNRPKMCGDQDFATPFI